MLGGSMMAEWRYTFMVEYRGAGITEIGIDELSWDYFVTVKGLSWTRLLYAMQMFASTMYERLARWV